MIAVSLEMSDEPKNRYVVLFVPLFFHFLAFSWIVQERIVYLQKNKAVISSAHKFLYYRRQGLDLIYKWGRIGAERAVTIQRMVSMTILSQEFENERILLSTGIKKNYEKEGSEAAYILQILISSL